MKTYELSDLVTFYFVIRPDERASGGSEIKAWTDDKSLLQFYLEFHQCSQYVTRKLNKTFKEMIKILNENHNDEITIAHITTKSDSKRDPIKMIAIPATNSELSVLRDSQTSGCAPIINYTAIHDYLPKFKGKYQQVFREIGLYDLVGQELYNRSTEFTTGLQIDELMMLFRAFPAEFG